MLRLLTGIVRNPLELVVLLLALAGLVLSITVLHVFFPRISGQDVKHLDMKQFIMEVRDVHDQKVLYGGVQEGSCCAGGEERQSFSSRPRLGNPHELAEKMAAKAHRTP